MYFYKLSRGLYDCRTTARNSRLHQPLGTPWRAADQKIAGHMGHMSGVPHLLPRGVDQKFPFSGHVRKCRTGISVQTARASPIYCKQMILAFRNGGGTVRERECDGDGLIKRTKLTMFSANYPCRGQGNQAGDRDTCGLFPRL